MLLLHKNTQLYWPRIGTQLYLFSRQNSVWRAGQLALTVTKAVPSASSIPKRSNMRGARQQCPERSPWIRTGCTQVWFVEHTVGRILWIAGTNERCRQARGRKQKKMRAGALKKDFLDTLWFTLRCAWIQQHRKAAACKQNWTQQGKYGSKCSSTVVTSAMSETSQHLRVRATACTRRTPDVRFASAVYAETKETRTQQDPASSSSSGCNSLQSEINRFFTAAH